MSLSIKNYKDDVIHTNSGDLYKSPQCITTATVLTSMEVDANG